MRRLTAVTIAMGLLTGAVAEAAQNSKTDLLRACEKEAQSSYELAWKMEPTLHSSIAEHRKRLLDACAAFATGKVSSTAALSQCLHASSSGPVHVQRGRNLDRDHVARQRELCRALGGDGSSRLNPPAQ